MFVVHFVGFSQPNQVLVIGIFEPFETLVNQDVVYREIAKTVKGNAQTNEKFVVHTSFYPEVKKDDAGYGKNDKKDVIALKNTCIFRLMMIGMKIPHQAVHNVFVGTPRNTFHKKENAQKNQKRYHFVICLMKKVSL
jgi:hypothetical protein